MGKYRTKPVEKEAIQSTGKNGKEIMIFMQAKSSESDFMTGSIVIKTLEGNMTASPGDWIIKGLRGEFYPCKPDIFEKTYEAVTP